MLFLAFILAVTLQSLGFEACPGVTRFALHPRAPYLPMLQRQHTSGPIAYQRRGAARNPCEEQEDEQRTRGEPSWLAASQSHAHHTTVATFVLALLLFFAGWRLWRRRACDMPRQAHLAPRRRFTALLALLALPLLSLAIR
jgi:hypothetical protein